MKMHTELEKIESYFKEAARIWGSRAEFARSREFFELWEKIADSKHFTHEGDTLALLGQTVEFERKGVRRTFWIEWDSETGCAALSATFDDGGAERLLLRFREDGSPCLELVGLQAGITAASEGECLDIVYDLIAFVQKNDPHADLMRLSKKEIIEALDAMPSGHPPRALAALRRMRKDELKRLFAKACEDMRLDELSPQLTLPLDGTYSAGKTRRPEDAGAARASPAAVVHRRTRRTILHELELLLEIRELAAAAEKEFTLVFTDAEVVGSRRLPDNTTSTMLKMKVGYEAPLVEGSVLRVFSKGHDGGSIGSLFVDVLDGDHLYGRLETDVVYAHDPAALADMQATAPRSSSPVLIGEARLLCELVRNESSAMLSPAIQAALGLVEASLSAGDSSLSVPERLDDSQTAAWRAAVDPGNVLSLIQGPPGTGKTHVLERIARSLCAAGGRLLITGPSNTAVDNICLKLLDLPVLRVGGDRENVHPLVAKECWHADEDNLRRFVEKRERNAGSLVFAGTHVGVMKSEVVRLEMEHRGSFSTALFDEAGMSRIEEFLPCARLAKRAVLLGDHKQLPPFPLSSEVLRKLNERHGALPGNLMDVIQKSAMEWLCRRRGFPVTTLARSYRCQHPRLIRFSSTFFYDAIVKAGDSAEYLNLDYQQLAEKYPPSTLTLYRTSSLPAAVRQERLVLEGQRPGLENPTEAALCVSLLYQSLAKYPLHEISIITPYRRQARLIRSLLSQQKAGQILGCPVSESEWRAFLSSRISTVDGFQGDESDVVIISYVRSNDDGGIGFVDDQNRINVAHTRARREMYIVCDIDCLTRQSCSGIFEKMRRAIQRDGVVEDVDPEVLAGPRVLQ